MTEADNNLAKAFELLIEEVERSRNTVVDQGIEAMRLCDYEKARQSTFQAERLSELETKVRALQREWLQAQTKSRKPVRARRFSPSKPHRTSPHMGEHTPREAFRKPILETLATLGGKAPASDVLRLVCKQMQPHFKPADWAPFASNPTISRWKSTAHQCRHYLVREGLLKDDSPHGIWEITDAGREWLKQETAQ